MSTAAITEYSPRISSHKNGGNTNAAEAMKAAATLCSSFNLLSQSDVRDPLGARARLLVPEGMMP
ncbi:MAG: hypothetical protein QXY49_00965 [Thermofilaceae archaeon]